MIAFPLILIVAVVVLPKVTMHHPRALHYVTVAESTIRGQGRVSHLGTCQINVLTLRRPLHVEEMTRDFGPGPGLRCPSSA